MRVMNPDEVFPTKPDTVEQNEAITRVRDNEIPYVVGSFLAYPAVSGYLDSIAVPHPCLRNP